MLSPSRIRLPLFASVVGGRRWASSAQQLAGSPVAMKSTLPSISVLAKVSPRLEQVQLSNLRPLPGSHIHAKRIGRGGKRGGSSGRGNGGQKHHNSRPPPWFTGLYTNPIIEALPRFSWSPRELKPVYKLLNLDRLQKWIDLGRIDPTRPITMREMLRSRLVHGPIRDGVKLLSRGLESLRTPNLRLEVTRASHAAIHAVEQRGGTVLTVYHTRRGLDCLLHPERHEIVPPFERPVLEQDILYYSNPLNRGYLFDRERFDREFRPRGYLADEQDDQEANREVHRAQVRYVVEGMAERLEELRQERDVRAYLHEKQLVEEQQRQQERQQAWNDGRWFPEQGDWKWIEVLPSGEIQARFSAPQQQQYHEQRQYQEQEQHEEEQEQQDLYNEEEVREESNNLRQVAAS